MAGVVLPVIVIVERHCDRVNDNQDDDQPVKESTEIAVKTWMFGWLVKDVPPFEEPHNGDPNSILIVETVEDVRFELQTGHRLKNKKDLPVCVCRGHGTSPSPVASVRFS